MQTLKMGLFMLSGLTNINIYSVNQARKGITHF